MFATVECEAVVFGCRQIRPDQAVNLPCVLAMPGADHILELLPSARWALLSTEPADEVRAQFAAAHLPAPGVVVATGASDGDTPSAAAPYLDAMRDLHCDPAVSLSFEDTAEGVAAAKDMGLQVIGLAAGVDAHALDRADLVVPSLLSVRVLGTHPFIVFEVDAIPDLGTGTARRR